MSKRSYCCEKLKELGYLNEDDMNILKHLQAIDNIYKNKNPNISNLFAFAGTLEVCTMLNGEEWCFDSFINIPCDGGDPNGEELRQEYELSNLLDSMEEEI